MKCSWWNLLLSCVPFYDKTTVWTWTGLSCVSYIHIWLFNIIFLAFFLAFPLLFCFDLFWMRLAGWCLDLLHIFLCMLSFWHHYFCRKYWKYNWKRTPWEKRGKWKSGKLMFLLSLRERKDLNRRFANILFDAKLGGFCNVWNPAFLLESFQLKQLFLWFTSPILSPLWQLDRVPVRGCFSMISISSAISDSVTDVSPAELSGDYWEWLIPAFLLQQDWHCL